MQGLMMDYPLTLDAILRRADTLYRSREIVSRLPDKSTHRYTYRDLAARSRRLAVGLHRLGIQDGDRIATFCWNNHHHLEAYFGIPAAGAILHTLNLRLHPDELAYIITHARDKAVIVDACLMPTFQKVRERIGRVQIIVASDEPMTGTHDAIEYESVLAASREEDFNEPVRDEQTAAAMCYTTGTTGKPKAVLYSHRALVLHSYASCMADCFGLTEHDVVCPVVPMFHANAWGLPFTCTMIGASQVFPGLHLDATSLAELLVSERVTVTAGVPTIWLGLLQLLDKTPGSYDLSRLRVMVVGGSAAPRSMIRAFDERHRLKIIHAWGMTEMTPLGTISQVPPDLASAPVDEQYRVRAKQGRPGMFVEIRARGDEGIVPWDGATMGELEVRGPSVARAYFEDESPAGKFTEDGWFRTGDIVTIDQRGFVEVQDRAKDLIKSGGEWISSVALENALMGHPAVAEAAVVGIPHEKWQERPLAVVVVKDGQSVTPVELRAFLAQQFASWWLPDAFELVTSIPRTSAGKFMKSALRQQFKDYKLSDQAV